MTKREAIPDGTPQDAATTPEGPGDTTVEPVGVKPDGVKPADVKAVDVKAVDVKAEAKSNGPVPVAEWENPLRDPRDRRLPRIAGPSGLVIFGVTGDLSRKKLMPAVYDLANRGLLPPGFSLVGFARRDWEDEDFAQIVHDSVKEHAR